MSTYKLPSQAIFNRIRKLLRSPTVASHKRVAFAFPIGKRADLFYSHKYFDRRCYNDLTDRFSAEEEKLKRLTAERKKRDAESVAIGGMLFELTELEAPPIEFDEKLWHAVVDHVTVYNDDRLVFSLKDGTEITVEL